MNENLFFYVTVQFVRPITRDTWRTVKTTRPRLRVRLEYRGDADDEQLTLPDAAAPVDQVHYSIRFKQQLKVVFDWKMRMYLYFD